MIAPLARHARRLGERYLPQDTKNRMRGAIGTALSDRVVSYVELAERDDVDVWRFEREREFTFERPDYYNRLPEEIGRIVGDHVSPQPFVLEVPDVTLIGSQGMKRTADGDFVVYNFHRPADAGASRELGYDVLDAVSMGTWPFRRPGGPTAEVELAVPLINRWARNYSHWTEECLAQLAGVRHYIRETGERPILLIPPDSPEFVGESLELLGFDETDYRELGDERLRVERMVLPSIRRVWSGTSDDYMRDPFGISWVREAVLQRIDEDADSPSKILVSRERDATVRRITNWSAVESALVDRGFEPVVLTEHDFREQKELFRNAETIVATHGAGLTELIYAEDASVIELFGSYVVPPYFEMSEAVGHRYGCLVCEPRGDDIRVDVDELHAAIDATTGADGS
ncbi:glycosyltransferase family 61 protein [Halobaculum lipolyticum]|uniref:Glycosyltransferase family 61 protein n=1 Tax=Halobaculum lipolyticum TaxID=3032001 RepID=A0ABD5WEW1_9EURY|nr:glycosyltransferase family 61 protein [Halobaculum sp. DT31]